MANNNGLARITWRIVIVLFLIAAPLAILAALVLPAFTLQQRPSGLEREVVRVGLGMAGLPARMASSRLRGALDIMMKSIDDEGIQFEPYPDFTQRYWLRSQENADGESQRAEP